MTMLPMVETTSSFGAKNFLVLTAAPASAAAATLAEATAGKEITCHLYATSVLFQATQSSFTPERHECQTVVEERLGSSTVPLQQVAYSWNFQTAGTPGADGNEAYEALPEGTERWILARYGIANGAARAVGQRYKLYRIKCGKQVEAEAGSDQGAELAINQMWELLDTPTTGAFAA